MVLKDNVEREKAGSLPWNVEHISSKVIILTLDKYQPSTPIERKFMPPSLQLSFFTYILYIINALCTIKFMHYVIINFMLIINMALRR